MVPVEFYFLLLPSINILYRKKYRNWINKNLIISIHDILGPKIISLITGSIVKNVNLSNLEFHNHNEF